MKPNYLLIYFLLLSGFGFAQNFDVGGTVKEASSGLVIPGVNVQVKNGTLGTSTDFDGNFTLKNIPAGSKLVFSYVGFKSFEYNVTGSKANIAIALQEMQKSLEEVVVLGYTSKKRKDVTGAVAVVSTKIIADLKPIKVDQALQGTVSGVTVTAPSGSPGADFSIKIRGVATNGQADATVLIDGSPGNLNLLNPEDVESITVLKDAQAAVYGTIGANGIVIITTKQGKKNSRAQVTVNSYTGFQETSRKLSLLNATEYALLLNESYANDGQQIPFSNVSNVGSGTNWQNEVFKKTPIYSNDFTVSGGSDKITYAFSASDLKQEGIVGGHKADYKRSTARIALGADIGSKAKIQSNFIYTYSKRRSLNENGLGSVLFNAINMAPTQSVRDADGAYTLVPNTAGYGIEIINPLAQMENTYNDYNIRKLNGNVKFTYDLLKELRFTSRLGFNTAGSISKNFAKQVSYGGKVFDVTRSRVDQNKINDNDYTIDLFFEYEKTFAENHKLKFTIGTTVYKQFGSGLYGSGYDVPNNSWEFADLSLANGVLENGPNTSASYQYDERRLSHFAFLDYAFRGKYLISGTIRRDLSSRFGPDKRIGIFPAVTGGWVVSEEPFLKGSSLLSFLKFRGSYGVLGNDQIGNNRYTGTLNGEAVYVLDGVLTTGGKAVGVLPNPKIQWEEAKKLDIGVDLKMFDNKLDITADYFDETRDGVLLEFIPVSGITGVAAPGSGGPTVNAGKVNNKGIELAIAYKGNITEKLNFNVGFNITKLENEVTEVNNSTHYVEGGAFGISQPFPARMEEGHPMGYFLGYVTDGIFQNQAEIDAHPSQNLVGSTITAPGDIRYKDLNGDGKIDINDRKEIGKPIADYTMGFNFNLYYKNFDLTSYCYASVGNDMVRNYERTEANLNKSNYVLGRWTGEGTSNTVPRVTAGESNNNVFSDYFVEDASYMRIQNLQLGYTVNPKTSEKLGISKLRLYTSVNNLYTFTKYRGYDPTATSGAPIGSGIDFGFYPQPRTYMVGANLTF